MEKKMEITIQGLGFLGFKFRGLERGLGFGGLGIQGLGL